MRVEGDQTCFFATDLTNFLGCRHLTALERLAAHIIAKRPHFDDPMLELLRERGLEHEQAYVQRLRGTGRRVVELSKQSPDAFADTMRAMREGADVIVQARLEHGLWAGWAFGAPFAGTSTVANAGIESRSTATPTASAASPSAPTRWRRATTLRSSASSSRFRCTRLSETL